MLYPRITVDWAFLEALCSADPPPARAGGKDFVLKRVGYKVLTALLRRLRGDNILLISCPCLIYLANSACLSYVDRAPPARRDRGLCPSASRKFYDFFCGLSKEAIFPDALGIVVLFQSRPVQPFCQILACRSSCAPSSSCPSTPSKGRSNKAGLNLRRLFPL